MPTRSGRQYRLPEIKRNMFHLPNIKNNMFQLLEQQYSSHAPNSNNELVKKLLEALLRRKVELYLAPFYVNNKSNISNENKIKIKQALDTYKHNLKKTAFSIIKSYVVNADEKNFNNYVSARLTNANFSTLLQELFPSN